MKKKHGEIKILIALALVQTGFIAFILLLFTFSTAINKKEMAQQITFQIQSLIKGAPSRKIPETLAAAQIDSFKAVGYFDQNGLRVFTLPASINPSYFSNRGWVNNILNGFVEIDVFFDDSKTKLAGTLKFSYSRFSFVPYALFFWFLSLSASMLLFRHYRKIWLSSLKTQEAIKRNNIVTKIVGQVDHDLKSPLQSLFLVADDSQGLTESDKRSMFSAIERIKGITRDLKSIHNNEKLLVLESKLNSKIEFFLFSVSLKELCEETKIAYKEKNIEVSFKVEPRALAIASAVSEDIFTRLCSNLIQNSIEAVEVKFEQKKGAKIFVHVDSRENGILISIKDNGVGIPNAHLDKITNDGFTFGKKYGQGLGLQFVIENIEKWGGQFQVESCEGEWTRSELWIPGEDKRHIYQDRLNLSGIERVLILDDDQSVYERWLRKLVTFQGKIDFIKEPIQVGKYVDEINTGQCLPLIDYEIRDAEKDGLKTAIDCDIAKKAYLVTNSYNKSDLVEAVSQAKCGIIPKAMIEDLFISV